MNIVGLEQVRNIIRSMRNFVDQVYLPNSLAIASFYKDWANRGEGLGNFMAYGEFPGKGISETDDYLMPSGIILDRNLDHIEKVDLRDVGDVQEFVAHAWYAYEDGNDIGLHPFHGETTLKYSGPKPPYDHLDVDQSYSWIKSPRWRGRAVEVGPLARVLLLYAKGNAEAKALTDAALKQLDLPFKALYSTLGRTLARAIETKVIADAMEGWLDRLMGNIKAGDLRTFSATKWDPSTWPSESMGVGHVEGPRGALGHWIVIRDGKIANYQAVVPTTWNAGPRDGNGQEGAYEAALKGHVLQIPAQPIEILRTIHSFDPCLACAVHVVDPQGEELIRVKVR